MGVGDTFWKGHNEESREGGKEERTERRQCPSDRKPQNSRGPVEEEEPQGNSEREQ